MTDLPFWYITDKKCIEMLGGIWVNRKDAEQYLNNSAYNFTKDAQIYCNSGFRSWQMRELQDILKGVK